MSTGAQLPPSEKGGDGDKPVVSTSRPPVSTNTNNKARSSESGDKKDSGPPLWVIAVVSFIKLVTFLYEMVSWPIYSLFSSGEPSVDDQGPTLACPTKDGDPSSPWRAVEALNDQRLSQTMFPGCSTLDDLWDRGLRLWPQAKVIGARPLIKVEMEPQPNGRKFKKLTQGPYHFYSFTKLTERITGIASGFLNYLKLRPRDDRVLIFAETRMEWMLTAQACFRTSIPLVTLYATLGDDALVHGVDESEVHVIMTSDELLSKVVNLLPRMPRIRHVIYMRDPTRISEPAEGDDFAVPKSIPQGVEVISLNELEARGLEYEDREETVKKAKPVRDDLAVIMYTSGSTGAPKGVEITHANIMCSLSGQAHRLPVISNKDRYIAYLPLAHVLELCCEIVLISHCVPVGYGAPLTLLDNSSKVKRGTKGDVAALRPTLMACVPTIIDRLHKTVWETVNDAGPLVREFFKWALQFKTRRLTYGFHSVLMDRIIFRRLRKILGGKVHFMLSGGAPLSAESQEFINACFCRLVQGYGLTETCGAGTLVAHNNLRGGHVGAPLRCLQIKLRAWEEGKYFPEDKPYPRGEVLIGGECVVRGYFKQEQKTKEDIKEDADGIRWFYTGDIGQFFADGTLAIIDRKKDLVKLQSGEYISLGKVELALANCPVVETICVYGESSKDTVVAIVVPKKKQILHIAASIGDGAETLSYEALCRDKRIRQAVLKQLQDMGREKRLERVEIPSAVTLDHNSWTPDCGLVTDALKLKRRAIEEQFKDDIAEMYGKKKSV